MSIPQPSESEVAKTGKLLHGNRNLVLIVCAAAILLAIFLGGFRALYRIARGKPASSVFDEEFIRLNLRQMRRIQPRTGSAHPRVNAGINPWKTAMNPAENH